MTLNDAEEAERLQSMEDQVDQSNAYSTGSNDNRDENAEERARDYQNAQVDDHRAVPSFQVIRELCIQQNGNDPDTSVVSQSIIEDGIASILSIIKLADQLAEAEKVRKAHEKEYETEAFRLTDIAAQHSLLQQKTEDTLAQASGTEVSLVTSLKKERDVVHATSGKHCKQHPTDRARSDYLKARVTDLTGQVIKVETLLCIFRSIDRMPLLEVNTMVAQQYNILGYLHTSRSMIPDFQVRVTESMEDEFRVLCQRLAAS